MKAITCPDARALLGRARAELESHEAANSLMLGVCGQLVRHPERFKATPYLKTVEDEGGLVLAALMTPPHKLIVYAHQGDLESGAKLLVEDLVGAGWQAPGVLGPSQVAQKITEKWAEVTGRGFETERRQRVYELRKVMSPAPERGSLRLARQADIELVARWWVAFHQEIFGQADPKEANRAARFRVEAEEIYLWEDKGPVSIATKTRPTRRGISISLVYTPPELRRRGHASACVGELSRLLLGGSREFCALFADLANATSNSIYQRIGYRPVCDYDEYAFLAA